jgi:hypothetical protein
MGIMSRSESALLLLVAIILGSCSQEPASAAPAATDTDAGVITGTVIYDDGKPVSNATIYAQPMGRILAFVTPSAQTDEIGHFVITHLSLGKYAVAAEKQDEDFPNMSMQFYSDGKLERVALTPENPAANVRVRLGPKAGVLFGTVLDSVTGIPLSPCVEFTRAKNPENFLSGTGLVKAKYRVLIPSDTDVLIKIWLDGYKPWYYPGTTNKSQRKPARLKPGEEVEANIRLESDRNAQPDGCGMPVGTVINH